MAKKKVSKIDAAKNAEIQKYMQNALIEIQEKLDEFDKNELHQKTLEAFIRLKDDKPRSALEKVQAVEILVQNLGGFRSPQESSCGSPMTNLYEVCAATGPTRTALTYQKWGLYIIQANSVEDIKRYLTWYKEFAITQLWLVGDGCRYSGFPPLFIESNGMKVLRKTIIHEAAVSPDKLETLDYIKKRLVEANEPKPKRILELRNDNDQDL